MQSNDKKGFGIASFVLSLVGLFIFGLPLGILALIFGIIGWEDSGLAKAGVFIGGFDVIAGFLLITMFL